MNTCTWRRAEALELELELQVDGSHPVWVLGTALGSLQGQLVYAPNCGATSSTSLSLSLLFKFTSFLCVHVHSLTHTRVSMEAKRH